MNPPEPRKRVIVVQPKNFPVRAPTGWGDRPPGGSSVRRYQPLRQPAGWVSPVPKRPVGRLVPLLFGLVALLALLVVGLTAYFATFADRIYLGVKVDGVDLGGATRAEAKARLAPQLARYAGERLTFRAGDRTWQPTVAEVGAPIDADQLVERAYAVGRTKGIPATSLESLGFDEAGRRAYFERLAREIDRPALAAHVDISPDIKAVIVPAQSGRELDVERALHLLDGSVRDLAGRTLELPVREVPPRIREAEVGPVRDRVAKLIGAPLTLKVEDRSWPVSPQQIAGLLDLSAGLTGETNPDRAVRFDPAKVQAFLEPLARAVKRDPADAQWEWRDNRIQIRQPAVIGRQIDLAQAVGAIAAKAASDDRTVVLPLTQTEPRLTEQKIQNLGIREMVRRTETSFAGSVPPRAHNVRLAATRLDNRLILPGETFSFNEAVGPTTLDAGWQVGYGIEGVENGDHKTVPSVAGGICQVATTLFQAVFWSGYQIEERNYHLYWIESYGQGPNGLPGLDATVDAPSLDFKFKNNSDRGILIHSGTDGDRLFFELYSTKPAWQVEVSQPKITNVEKADSKLVQQPDPTLPAGQTLLVEHAVDGFQSEIVRTVRQGAEPPRVLKLVSLYKPSANVMLVGTGGR